MKTVEAPVSPSVFPLSVEAYRSLGEAGLIPKNTELLYGVVYKQLSKSPRHSFLARGLLDLLANVLPGGHILMSEQPITCSNSEPEPDVAVVRGTRADFRRRHPQTAALVIEVCLTNLEYDRSKLRANAEASVKEVWLLLVHDRQVEVYLRPKEGRYVDKKIAGPGGRLASSAPPKFVLDLDAFFKE